MKHFTSKGFTLIETMVAVTILALAISGPLLAASRAIVAAEVSRDQLTASYLAQEGIEYVRAMRDDEYLKLYVSAGGDTTAAWGKFLNVISACRSSAANPQACSFDPVGTGGVPSLSLCSAGVCPQLHLANNGQTNYYTTNPSAPNIIPTTAFTRTIRVVDASTNGATDVRIVSTVTWSFHGTPYTVTVTDHLTPWQ
ncbi:MAG: type IV pilus modification PilV family protein [Minisyncoccota bacterium]